MRTPPGFNWLTTLEKAQWKEPDEYEILLELACEWPTCACGELCKALPRNRDGVPLDRSLSWLGYDFYHYVRDRKWGLALVTFREIEARSAELILCANQNAPGCQVPLNEERGTASRDNLKEGPV